MGRYLEFIGFIQIAGKMDYYWGKNKSDVAKYIDRFLEDRG